MATVYGNILGGTVRPYATYEITETDGNVTMSVSEIGVEVPSTSTYREFRPYQGNTIGTTLRTPIRYTRKFNGEDGILRDYTRSFVLLRGERKNLLSTTPTKTVTKSSDAQTITLDVRIIVPDWTRVANSGASTNMDGAEITLSLSITVPPAEKPTVAITGSRNNITPSTVDFSATVNSFVGDSISSIVITDGNGNVLARKITTTTIGESGQITQSFTVQGLTTGSIVAKVTAIGRGGASAEESTIIPVAFFTMDVQAGGKEIAFGSSAIDTEANASEHGKFNCFMDAMFHNGFSCEKPLFKTATLEHTIPSISAHSYASNVSLTPPTISGYKPIAIAGFGSGSFRIYASYLRLTEDDKVSLTLGNSTATNFTQGGSVFRVTVLYAQEGICE